MSVKSVGVCSIKGLCLCDVPLFSLDVYEYETCRVLYLQSYQLTALAKLVLKVDNSKFFIKGYSVCYQIVD